MAVCFRSRKQLIPNGTLVQKDEFYQFTKDVGFSSPRGAAAVIEGGSAKDWLSGEPRMEGSSKNSTNSPNPALPADFLPQSAATTRYISFGQKPLRLKLGPGDHHPDRPPPGPAESGHEQVIRVQAVVSLNLCRRGQPDRLMDHSIPLWHPPGPRRPGRVELPPRLDLGHHAPRPLCCRGAAAGRVHRRVAVTRDCRDCV